LSGNQKYSILEIEIIFKFFLWIYLTKTTGSIIIEEGSHPDGKWYIIDSGSVSVSVADQKIARLHAGNMFWEIALLNEEARTATITAEDEVETIILSQEALFEMIENDDNSINKEIMRRMEENLEKE